MKRRALAVLKAAGASAGGAMIAFLCAFYLFPRSVVTSAFLWPGIVLLNLVGGAIPDSVIYALVPQGGPLAAMLIGILGSLLFWAVSTLVAWRLFVALRSRQHSLNSPPSNNEVNLTKRDVLL